MVLETEKNFEVIENSRARENRVSEKSVMAMQTNPIVRKLLDFSLSDKTRKFSVRDLFQR